jgi:hypothetical protein
MDMAMISPQDNKTKAIGIAVGASIIAAVAAMLVPTSILETLTGATGLSELVPATAAPLGDKARALIAFTAGAATMILALAYLLRRGETKNKASIQVASESHINQKGEVNMIAMLKDRMSNISLPKMPWSRDENSGDVLELSDLLKLRTADAHPDYPARRPISATSDLGNTNLYGQCAPLPSVSLSAVDPEVAVVAVQNDQEFVSPQQPVTAQEQLADDAISLAPIHAPTAPPVNSEQPSLSDLVAQFEQAIEIRKAKLDDMEAVAEHLATKYHPAEADSEAPFAPAPAAPREAVPAPRPPLEAVPVSRTSEDDEDMDAALNAALATLQRMNFK